LDCKLAGPRFPPNGVLLTLRHTPVDDNEERYPDRFVVLDAAGCGMWVLWVTDNDARDASFADDPVSQHLFFEHLVLDNKQHRIDEHFHSGLFGILFSCDMSFRFELLPG